jgi:membrane-associated phospholipid phosphatase
MKSLSNDNKWKILLSLLLYFITYIGFGQTPYEIKPKLDFALVGGSALTLTVGQIAKRNTYGLTLQEINDLSVSQVNAFDRNAVYNNNVNAKAVSDILAISSILLPSTLLLNKDVRSDLVIVGVMGIETLMLTYGITSIVKPIALRTRPYAYNPNVPVERKQEEDARFSFFSAHTASAAAMTFFGAKVYSDLYPNSKWKPVVWSVAAILPIATGWTSVASAEHFPTDVIVGYVIGAAIGYSVPIIHLKKRDTSKAQLELTPYLNGIQLTLTF